MLYRVRSAGCARFEVNAIGQRLRHARKIHDLVLRHCLPGHYQQLFSSRQPQRSHARTQVARDYARAMASEHVQANANANEKEVLRAQGACMNFKICSEWCQVCKSAHSAIPRCISHPAIVAHSNKTCTPAPSVRQRRGLTAPLLAKCCLLQPAPQSRPLRLSGTRPTRKKKQ